MAHRAKHGNEFGILFMKDNKSVSFMSEAELLSELHHGPYINFEDNDISQC